MTHRIFAGGLHDLTQADADALSLITLVRAQPLLQDGNNFRENFLSELPHQVAQCSSCNLKQHDHKASVNRPGVGTFTVTGGDSHILEKTKNSGF